MRFELVTASTFDSALEHCLSAEGLLALDTEQPSLDVRQSLDLTISIQLAPDNHTSYLFPLRFVDASVNLDIDAVRAAFVRVWSACLAGRFRLVFANASFDLESLHTWHARYWPKRCLEDVVVKAWIADPVGVLHGMRYGLKDQVETRLAVKMTTFKGLVPVERVRVDHPRLKLIAHHRRYHFERLDPRTDAVLSYACSDALYTRRLALAIKLSPQQHELYEAELATAENVRRYRAKGLYVDVPYALDLHARRTAREEEILERVDELLPVVPDGSYLLERRLVELWREHLLTISPPKRGKWTQRYRDINPKSRRMKTFQRSLPRDVWKLDDDMRNELLTRDLNPTQRQVTELLQELAHVQKDLQTYLPALLSCDSDGRLICDVRAHGQDTARFSGGKEKANPRVPWALNALTLPKRVDVKRCLSAPPGMKCASLDVVSEEPCLACIYSVDPSMTRALAAGLDFHTNTASHIFSVALDVVTPEQRGEAKPIGLSLLYTKSARTLALERKKSLDWAIQVRDRIANGYAGLSRWVSAAMLRTIITGRATTMWGRIVPVERPTKRGITALFKDAANSHIQSAGSDTIRILIDACHRWLDAHAPGSYLVSTVHDSLDLHILPEHEALLPALCEHLGEQCTPPGSLVKLKLDIQTGESFGELQKLTGKS